MNLKFWFGTVDFGSSVSGESLGTTATLQLNKVIPGRTYTITRGTDLQSFPDTISTLNPDSEELDKVVQDTASSSQKVFYQVDVTQP